MSHSVQRFLVSHGIMIIAYAILLAISILIQDVEFSTYGEIIYHETTEWKTGAIVAVSSVPATDSCPPSTEYLTSTYIGLHTICKKDDSSSYVLEACSKQPGYKTQYGFN